MGSCKRVELETGLRDKRRFDRSERGREGGLWGNDGQAGAQGGIEENFPHKYFLPFPPKDFGVTIILLEIDPHFFFNGRIRSKLTQ